METVVVVAGAIFTALLLTRWYGKFKLRRAGVVEVGVTETERLMTEDGALVVDVRDVRDFRAGRIPRSRNIALREIEARLDELDNDRHRPIILSCRSGRSSALAAVRLCRKGFSNVYNLKGGINAWLKANRELER